MNGEIKLIGVLIGGISVLILSIMIPTQVYNAYLVRTLATSAQPLELACAMASDHSSNSACLVLMSKKDK